MTVERLERLVVEWRERAEVQYSRPAEEALLDCAEELAAALSSRDQGNDPGAASGPLAVSTEEAAEMLNVNVKTVSRWARESQDPEKDENRLPHAFKTSKNGNWRIPQSDIRDVLYGRRDEEKPEEGNAENVESLLDR